MDRSNLSLILEKGFFLGSRDRVLVGGVGNSTTELQVHYAGYRGGGSGFQEMCNLSLDSKDVRGTIQCMDLCGIPRLGKTFAAVGVSDTASTSLGGAAGKVVMADVETLPDSAYIQYPEGVAANSVLYHEENIAVSSLSFFSDSELLAVGNEAGVVVVLDMQVGREISRIKAHPGCAAGINQLTFTRAGQLFTAGGGASGKSSPIKLWDLRTGGGSTGSPALALIQQLDPHQAGEGGAGTADVTCLASPAVQGDRHLVSGNARGGIDYWDLRALANLSFQPHSPNSFVTAVAVHPRRMLSVLSSATDGSIVSTHVDQGVPAVVVAAAGSADGSDGQGSSDASCYSLLHREDLSESTGMTSAMATAATTTTTGAITSIDCDNSTETCYLLATSNIGGLTRLAI